MCIKIDAEQLAGYSAVKFRQSNLKLELMKFDLPPISDELPPSNQSRAESESKGKYYVIQLHEHAYKYMCA